MLRGWMNANRLVALSSALAVLALAACGSPRPAASTGAPAPAAPAPSPVPTPPPTATPAPTPTPVVVPDFPVVAYQGSETFGGAQGHFAAVFAGGRPVVLLYFAGL
jgi:hypothetical protein